MKKLFFKVVVLAAGIYSSVIMVQSCKNNDDTPKTIVVKEDTIHPVEFPQDLGIEGFSFPEDSNKIYSWLGDSTGANYDSASIINHAWGIWAGLTKGSGEMYKGQEILIYETWLGPTDLAAMTKNQNKNGACGVTKNYRAMLAFPHQLSHSVVSDAVIDTNQNFYVSVSYDPNAACYATNNLIFNQAELDKYVIKDNIGKIPAFPQKAITTKPTYFIAKVTDGLVRIPSWPGPPNPLKSYGFGVWDTYVYADVANGQPEGKVPVPVSGNAPTKEQIGAATCNLNDFINFKIDSSAAAYINKQESAQTGTNVEAGDLVVLVAMHVATKEISNWTWQTYFWTANPDQPLSPSSAVAASLRPKSIKGAAAHYAVSTAYAMVLPNQPIAGGTNKKVKPVFGYNPYLEAVFGPAVFAAVPNRLNPALQYGVQTNCISCHAMAQYDPQKTISFQNNNPPYSTAQYIDMSDKKLFKNKVQLDFAWSIIANVDSTVKNK